MPNASLDTITTAFDADIQAFQSKMTQLNASCTQAMNQVVATAKASSSQINSSFGSINIGKSLESGFNELKGNITSAMGPLSGLAGALEALGPVGIGAATSIAAAFATLNLTMKAADWAVGVQGMADKLGVTVEEVQKWSIMAAAAGLTTEQFTGSMTGLEQTVGKVQDNLTRGKNSPALRIWEDVFRVSDPKTASDDLKALGNNIDAIRDKVVSFAATGGPNGTALGAPQRNAVAAATGMDPDVLAQLVEYKKDMDDAVAAAQKFGVIVPESVIKTSAEASNQMHVAAQIAGDQLRNAFLQGAGGAQEFSGALIAVATYLGDVVRGLEMTVGWIGSLIGKIPLLSSVATELGNILKYATPLGMIMDLGAGQRNQQAAAAATDKGPAFKPAAPVTGTGNTAKKGPRDQTAELDASAKAAMDAANQALSDAKAHLAQTIEAEARAELQKIDAASDKKIDELNKQRATIIASKNDKDKAAQLADIDYAIAVQNITDTLQKQTILNKENIDLTNAQNQAIQAHTELLNDALTTQAKLSRGMSGLTDNPQQKQTFDTQALLFEQQAQRNSAATAVQTDSANVTTLQQNAAASTQAVTEANLALVAAQAKLTAAVAAHSPSVAADTKAAQDQNEVVVTATHGLAGTNQALADMQAKLVLATQQQQELTAVQAQEQQLLSKQQFDQNNPLFAKADSLGGFNAAQMNTDMQNVATSGIGSLADGLTGVITQTEKFGDMWHKLSLQIVSDILKSGIEKLLMSPFTGKNPFSLGGSASGGNPLSSILGGATGGGSGMGSLTSPMYVRVINSTGGILGSDPMSGVLGQATGADAGGFSSFGGAASGLLSAFGLASGTDFAPGGLTMVGEKGPELMAMPRGAQVLPNNLLRNAVNTGGTGGGSNVTLYNLTTNVNASDAVLTSSVKSWIADAHTNAIQVARQQAGLDSARKGRNALNT